MYDFSIMDSYMYKYNYYIEFEQIILRKNRNCYFFWEKKIAHG